MNANNGSLEGLKKRWEASELQSAKATLAYQQHMEANPGVNAPALEEQIAEAKTASQPVEELEQKKDRFISLGRQAYAQLDRAQEAAEEYKKAANLNNRDFETVRTEITATAKAQAVAELNGAPKHLPADHRTREARMVGLGTSPSALQR